MANPQGKGELPLAPVPSWAHCLTAICGATEAPSLRLGTSVHAAQAQHSAAHLPVAEVQANHELLEDPARMDLQQAAVGLLPQQVLEQVSTLSKLHGDAQMGGREEHLQGSRHSSQVVTWACVQLLGLGLDPV